MRRKITELKFDAIIAEVDRATDVEGRRSADPLLQSDISRVKTTADAVQALAASVGLAATGDHEKPAALSFEQPLVQAMVRIIHHPQARPISSFKMKSGAAGPRFKQLAEEHPEAGWDADAVQTALIAGICAHADQVVDDKHKPWLMHWGPALRAAKALFLLTTLRKLGHLTPEPAPAPESAPEAAPIPAGG